MTPRQSNPFLDTILGKFATRLGIMETILKVVWQDSRKRALIAFRSLDPEKHDDLLHLLRDTLKEVKEIKFHLQGQQLTYRGQKIVVLGITEK